MTVLLNQNQEKNGISLLFFTFFFFFLGGYLRRWDLFHLKISFLGVGNEHPQQVKSLKTKKKDAQVSTVAREKLTNFVL